MFTKCPYITVILFFITSMLSAQDTIKAKKDSAQVYTLTDEIPQFPGGMGAMSKFVASNIRFPERCRADSLFRSCKVFLKFIINEDGGVSDIKVLKGCPGYPECDSEGIRVIGLMPKWTAAKVGGVSVKSYFNLPLSFKLQ